jgi:hypothetical protein
MEIKLHAFYTPMLQGGGQLHTMASLDVASKLLGLAQAMVHGQTLIHDTESSKFLD